VRASDDLRATSREAQSVASEVYELREALRSRDAQIEDLRHTASILNDEIRARDRHVTELKEEKIRLEVELGEGSKLSSKQARVLESRLEEARYREKVLAKDLKRLHKYVSKRELEVLDLADRLSAEDEEKQLKRDRAYQRLKKEREEAERLEALARARIRRRLSRGV
jgi:DNA repair exonuclease SbcCD ATPase subunit